jgi:hypothetical protein
MGELRIVCGKEEKFTLNFGEERLKKNTILKA